MDGRGSGLTCSFFRDAVGNDGGGGGTCAGTTMSHGRRRWALGGRAEVQRRCAVQVRRRRWSEAGGRDVVH
ncbi:hypothetical protein RHMOL_Rhmol06G0013000 [Rhododendron molle]|uniref:Uncharacterized protein n=1 Tax=Rhododendron molle TaxID=49168 RepID=A0ACC0N7P5_RHOML|nr:hypothetical protein RHMOL_Rhmol06G0013000 [Rhododendron molle]